MTIRREVHDLELLGLLRETGFRKGKQKQYQSLFNKDGANPGAYSLIFGNYGGTAIQWLDIVAFESTMMKVGQLGRYLIARLMTQAAVDHSLPVGIDEGAISMKGSKAILEQAIKSTKSALEFLDQLNNIPAWNTEFYLTLFGNHAIREDVEMWDKVRVLCKEYDTLVMNSPVLLAIDNKAVGAK